MEKSDVHQETNIQDFWTLKIFIVIILSAAAFSFCYSQHTLLLEGGTLIDGTGKQPVKNSVIVIDGEKIVDIGESGKIKIPKGIKTIKLKGKFIIPGLIDANACYETPRDLVQLLAWGVTSANLIFESTDKALEIEKQSKDNAYHYPRIYVTAPVFTARPGWWRGKDFSVDTAVNQFPLITEEAKEQIQKVKEKKIERISILYDSLTWCRDPLPGLNQINKDVVIALIKEARANKIFSCVMTAKQKNAIEVIDYGPSAFMNGILDFYIDKPFANALQGRNIFFISDFCYFEMLSDIYGFVQNTLADERFKSALPDNVIIEFSNPDYYNQTRGKYPNIKFIQANLENLRLSFRRFLREGVLIAPGSGIWILPGITLHLEMEKMVNAGMSPMQVITAATQIAARFLSVGKDVGTIEKGKTADILVLSGDPLDDIRNTRKIEIVIKQGSVYSHKGLIIESKR